MKKLALAFSTSALVFVAQPARANGDQKHSEHYRKSEIGLRALSAGIGLAGRNNAAPATPVLSADLVVDGLPANAVIDRSFLYWITHGTAGSVSITVKGTNVPGTLIGTSGDTCWDAGASAAKNFVYRADVTTLINANGPYALTGFPSGPTESDTQGAGVFIVYRDPSEQARQGTILLRDGAMNNNIAPGADDTYPDTRIPDGLITARFFMGAGDGQAALADGLLQFNKNAIPGNPAGQHFRNDNGKYWDDPIYDVRAFLPDSGVLDLRWFNELNNDCIAFAYTALELQSPPFDAGPGSDTDAGSSGSSSSSSSSGAGGASSSSGSSPADAGSSGNLGVTPGGGAPDDASDGCGCRSVTSTISPAAAGVGLALALAFAARRRSRKNEADS